MRVACPHCSAAYNVDDRRIPAAGLNVRCPKCRKTFPVRTDDAARPASGDAPVSLPPPSAAAVALPPPSEPSGAPAAESPGGSGSSFAASAAIPLPPPAAAIAPPPPPDLSGFPPAAPPALAPPPPEPDLFAVPPQGPSAGSIPLPPPAAPAPDPFAAPPAPAGAAPPDPFAGGDPFAASPEPSASQEPFAASPEKFRAAFDAVFDPLPVPSPEPARAPGPFGRAPPAPAEPPRTEPFSAVRAPPPGAPAEPGLGFGEVDFSEPPPPAAPRAPARAAPPLSSPGDELEMLFGEAAPKVSTGPGFKVRRRSGKIFGPFEEAQVVDMLAKGELMGNEDVAPEGGAWTPIGAVPAFGEALRKLSAEPAGAMAFPEGDTREPQRLVPFGDRMAPALLRSGDGAAPSRRWVRTAGVVAAALVLAGAGVAGFLRYGPLVAGLLGRGDAPRAAALSAQARAAAAKGDYPSERAALDLAAQAVAANRRSPDPAGLHAAIVAALEQRHGAPPEAVQQARAAADRLEQDEKGEIGTLAARLAVTLVTAPGPATQPHESALEQAAQKRPPDAELIVLLANAAIARGDGARADALFTRLAAIEPGVRALHGAGRAALARGDAAAAKAAFAKALEKEPSHLPSRLELAALAEAAGDVAQAEAQLAPLLAPAAEAKLGPAERARALLVRGRILARTLATAGEADAAFASAVQADARLVDARVSLAAYRVRRGDPAGAVAATDAVAAQAARTPALAAVRIRALALAGRALDASSLAAAALQLAPGDLGLLLANAATLELSGKTDEAVALYRSGAGRNPSAFEPRLALGRIALSRKDYAQAASEIGAAVEKGPREPAAHAALGDLRAAQGDGAGAEAAYRAALALDPEHAHAEIGLAKLALARGDVAGARARLERALAAEPRNVDGRLTYGTLLWKAKDLPEAEKAFQAAVDLAPRHALALTRLGAVKLERGDVAGAVKVLTTASSEDGRLAEARLWLGRALLANRETPGAIAQLRKAIELDPAVPEHHLYLGDALEKAGALAEAIEAYRAAAAADPKSSVAHERIGTLYAANNRCDAAVPAFERAIAVAPRVSRLRIDLGDCKRKLGKNEEAAKIFRDVLKADPAAVQVLYKLARAVHEAESPRAAQPLYERAAREDRQNAMPHYYLGYMYKEKNQRARAVEEFRKYLALKPDAEDRKDIEAEIEDLGGAR